MLIDRGRRARICGTVLALLALGVAPSSATEAHYRHFRFKLSVPAPHKQRSTRRSVSVPKDTEWYAVTLQFPSRSGKGYSPPVRPGQVVEYKAKNGKPLLRVGLAAKDDSKHYKVRYVIYVQNLNISRRDYKRMRVPVIVTVGYRAHRPLVG